MVHNVFYMSLLPPWQLNLLPWQCHLSPPPVEVDDKEENQVEEILNRYMHRQ